MKEQLTILGVEFELTHDDGDMTINRVFVPGPARGNKMLKKVLPEFIARHKGKHIYVTIYADSDSASIHRYLKNCFLDQGFKPLNIDGRIYPNDLILKNI